MKIDVATRAGTAVTSVEVPAGATVRDLKKAIHGKKPRLHPSRQRLTLDAGGREPTVLEDAEKLSKYGITGDGFRVLFKDLGPQLSFMTVYLIEYLGPLVLYPLVAVLIHGWHLRETLTDTQKFCLLLWTVHFVKRELETVFVHEFGSLTMPVFNVFKNSMYYWGFGVACSLNVNWPGRADQSSWHLGLGLPVFLGALFMNAVCHMQLKSLRTKGSSEWIMPHGGLFELVACPNYLMEIVMWLGWNIVAGFPPVGVLFNICGALQMWKWAKERHDKYRKIFKDYPKSRRILIPYVL